MNRQPNIVLIYADDLGRGMLSCYGQKLFQTPNIDRLAQEGVRFNRCYGTAMCAPARASLLCGIHDAHLGRWKFNSGGIYEKQMNAEKDNAEQIFQEIDDSMPDLLPGQLHLAALARRAGYHTAEIGKLEWGFSTTPKQMSEHGWDYHFGYYDHQQCHGFYPGYLFENGKIIEYPENTLPCCGKRKNDEDTARKGRSVYSQDLFDEKILTFIEKNRANKFFLYHPTQLPHGPVFFPDIYEEIQKIPGLTQIEREYASMVVRLDRTVGKIYEALEKHGILEDTMIIFTSDNGHELYYEKKDRCSKDLTHDGILVDNIHVAFRSDTCGDVFNGNSGLAGLKTTNWEGGARLPHIVRWGNGVRQNAVSERLISNYDIMALLADLCHIPLPAEKDGVSYLPELLGDHAFQGHEYVIYSSFYGPAIVSAEGYKLRTQIKRENAVNFSGFGEQLQRMLEDRRYILQLYDLKADPEERRNIIREQPQRAKEMLQILLRECDGNLVNGMYHAHFSFFLDPDTPLDFEAGL